MRITLEIPDELFVMSMTLVAPRLPDGGVYALTHCCTLQDGENITVKREEQNGVPFYRAFEE